jgi:transcriptional regulator with XRE-family HTH domain
MTQQQRKWSKADTHLEVICQKTGMVQEDLAIVLSVAQSIISRYLKGTRNLPTNAMINMAQLYNRVTSLPDPPVLQPTSENREQLAEHAVWCRFQAKLLQRKLDEVVSNQQQAGNMLKLLDAGLLDGNLTPQQQLWTDEQHYAMQTKYTKNSWLVEQQLRIRIDLFLREAELNEAASTG